MNVLNRKVSVVKNCKATKTETVILENWLLSNVESKKISDLRLCADPNEKQRIKHDLEACTISGYFRGKRESENLCEHSGLLCLDIDSKDNTHILNFHELKEIISTAPFVAYISQSASGNGLFVIVPVSNPGRHAEHFDALKSIFLKLGIVIDPSGRDITRLRFKSMDDQPFINRQAELFKGLKREAKIITLSKSQDHVENLRWVETALEAIEMRGIDLTGSYEKWLHLGFAFSSAFGEEGRDFFHRVSQFYPEYSSDAADVQYDRCLRSGKPGITLATFYHECTKAGIQIKPLIDFR